MKRKEDEYKLFSLTIGLSVNNDLEHPNVVKFNVKCLKVILWIHLNHKRTAFMCNCNALIYAFIEIVSIDPRTPLTVLSLSNIRNDLHHTMFNVYSNLTVCYFRYIYRKETIMIKCNNNIVKS